MRQGSIVSRHGRCLGYREFVFLSCDWPSVILERGLVPPCSEIPFLWGILYGAPVRKAGDSDGWELPLRGFAGKDVGASGLMWVDWM